MDLSLENQEWRTRFLEHHGRVPRILHIGNIANNAYSNAKLLQAVGTDNDVICYDYYHCMGCPEWEDADFEGTIANDFQPDWSTLEMKGFERPAWFAQGPQRTCLEYLLAVRTGQTEQAEQLWHSLAMANRTVPSAAWRHWHSVAISMVMVRLAKLYHLTQADPGKLFPGLTARLRKLVPGWQMLVAPALRTGWKVLAASATMAVRLGRYIGLLPHTPPQAGEDGLFAHRRAQLIDSWPRHFPDRADTLQETDLDMYLSSIELWRRLFGHYDIVIGYATDGIWPLLADKPYLAFEHGTIREIPYHATTQGRNTAMAYRNAAHVFVTNFDCLPSAQCLAPGRFTPINHPYDEDHGLQDNDWTAQRTRLRTQLDSDLICFFPTRHDWVAGTGYADKANDVFLRAFAHLRRAGVRIGVVCCEWGANIAQSRQLIADEGLTQHVLWDRPMAMMKFERMARACDLVVDQFKLGAFGGIVFKAMGAGAPILTYLDEQRLLAQYPEVPPVINCQTTDDIVEALSALAREPHKLVAAGEASRTWIKRHHGKQNTVNLQFDQFREMVSVPDAAQAGRPQTKEPA